MPRFTKQQIDFFGATIGGGSKVTSTEARHDVAVTVTLRDGELSALHRKIPKEDIPRTHKNKTKIKWSNFYNFNKKKCVALRVEHPKEAGNDETRIYFNEKSGFKPKAGEYWFIYYDKNEVAKNQLVIGTMSEVGWVISGGKKDDGTNIVSAKVAKTSGSSSSAGSISFEDHDPVGEPTQGKKYKTSPTIRKKALEAANYKCEFNSSHKTFPGKYGMQHVETHHLIPRSKKKFDVLANIVALCPTCHAKVHYAEVKTRFEMLRQLFDARESKLKNVGCPITLAEIAEMYKCLDN